MDASHRLFEQRVELAIIEGRQYAGALAIRAALIFFAGLVFLAGLIAADVTVIDRARLSSSSAQLWCCAALQG